ncbi:host specificity factor TipJ family phage tail protein [Xanthobacteraceae bacterium A53D]
MPAALWSRVRPKVGTLIYIRPLPGNGDLLRAALTITLVVAAAAISGGLLSPLGGAGGLGFSLASGSVGANIAAAGTLIAGSLLINALVPVRQPQSKGQNESPTYSINGMRNVANPGGVVPYPLGENRWAPPYAAMPYVEVVGSARYVVAAFVVGYGPQTIEDIRIGDTPITKYTGVETEVREGLPTDLPLTLYPKQVIEEALSVTLTLAGGSVARFTAPDVTEAAVDITFAQGLLALLPNGDRAPGAVQFRVRYRKDGIGDWTVQGAFTCADKTQQPVFRSYRFAFPSRGQYEVEVTRLTLDYENQTKISVSARSDWTALRSFRPEYPIAMGKPLALVAVRIKATNQLNGTLDQLNVVSKSRIPDWTGSAWVDRATRNPASHFRHVLTGPAIAYPLSPEDLDAIEEWHDFCRVKGLTYDRVHDFVSSVAEVLSDIAAAGRASPQDRGGKWGVVVDRIQTSIRGHISPRNSWGFRGSRQTVRFPDAFRVKFKDRTHDYADAERIVPWPGFVGDPVVTEELALPGITDPASIWREARRRQHELMLRPDSYSVSQDFEQLLVTRGDLVRLSHDVLSHTQVAARVTAVSGKVVELDELVTMEEGQAYACRFRSDANFSTLRLLSTLPGTSREIMLSGEGAEPEVGDLALFGPAGSETFEMIVKGVEVSEDLVARLTLVDHAPEIETRTDAEVPPAWNGRVGAERDPSTVAPGTPSISSILSGRSAGMDAVVVSLAPGPGLVLPATYTVQHRLTGATSWVSVVVPVAAGAASLTGYAIGQSVEMRALATSLAGIASPLTAIATHVVGSSDPAMQDVTSLTAVWTGDQWRYSWVLETLVEGMEPAAGVRIRYLPSTGHVWEDMTPVHTGLLNASPWDISFPTGGHDYTFGAVSVTADGTEGTPFIISLADPYRVVGTAPSLVASIAGNRYEIDGVTVEASDILTRTGGVKWVSRASGAPEMVAANVLALTYVAGRRRLVLEGAATNLLLNSTTLATQVVAVTAQQYTLSFWGAGTITLSGGHVATVAGGGANVRRTLTFTPAAGTLTCTVSGAVSRAQLEIGGVATSWIETAGAAVTRATDTVQLTPAAAARLGDPAVTVAYRGSVLTFAANQRLVGLTGADNLLRGGATATDTVVVGAATSITLAGAGYPGPLGACIAWDASGRAGAVNGGAVSSAGTPVTMGLANVYLGRDNGLIAGTRYELDELVFWPVRGTGAAIQSQARVWA